LKFGRLKEKNERISGFELIIGEKKIRMEKLNERETIDKNPAKLGGENDFLGFVGGSGGGGSGGRIGGIEGGGGDRVGEGVGVGGGDHIANCSRYG